MSIEPVEYVQLRRSTETDWDTFWYRSDPKRKQMVQQVANALFLSWFPDVDRGPKNEDLKNWISIAYLDAEIAIMALVQGESINIDFSEMLPK